MNEGLTTAQANEILARVGPNTLPEKPPESDLSIFLSQFKNPLIYVLILAGALTVFLGHTSDSIIISVVVFVNTILGFVQERKASRALYALKKLITPKTFVIRGGKKVEIDAANVVPGDLVSLGSGMKVPADCKITFANRVYVDESILTGESIPVEKKVGDEIFMGTIVQSGQLAALAVTTGPKTKIGQIAESIQKDSSDTPLKRQMRVFTKSILKIVVFLTFFVVVVGLMVGIPTPEIIKTAAALAVSTVPEGLVVSLTVVLAVGMQRILARKGLVRNLTSAETLGGVTTICVDKTGTLTEGVMRVVGYMGSKNDLSLQAVVANDLDDPLVISAYEWGKKMLGKADSRFKRIDSIPFSAKDRFFASLNKWKGGKNIIFVNGAPDYLLKWCDLTPTRKKEIMAEIEKLTSEGKRLVGFARKSVAGSKRTLSESDVKNGLTWVGILSFSDPVRSGVSEALTSAQKAGISIMVITGDYPNTAANVLTQIGMPVTIRQILLGEDLAKMSEREVSESLTRIKLFARTTPELKLKIVNALKLRGEVVAMMGDGVNDAPALAAADIGIVVGSATDVAKESSDLILFDSNFATIVAAIEEGRGIFENLRKIILYLLSDAFGEIITVIAAIILRLPIPITAVQILWINIVSDGFPDLALTVDPKRIGVMNEPPRKVSEPLVTTWMKALILLVSGISGLSAVILFIYVMNSTGDYSLAKSVTFLTLGINSLVYVFSIRNLTTPFWKSRLFDNKWLNWGVIVGLVLQVVPFLTPATRNFFGVVPVGPNYWTISVGLALSMFFVVEVSKAFIRKSQSRK